jgi:hypothetical protein
LFCAARAALGKSGFLEGRRMLTRRSLISTTALVAALPATAAEAKALEDVFGRWSWHTPEHAPRLLVGWIGSAMIGGALR